MKKPHYLEGTTHAGELDGRKILTTWSTTKTQAERLAETFRVEALARIFTDGRVGFRIVGYW